MNKLGQRLTGTFGNLGRFLREVRAELRKVIWPNRKETILYTSVVLISVGAVALIIWVFDSVLSLIMGALIR